MGLISIFVDREVILDRAKKVVCLDIRLRDGRAGIVVVEALQHLAKLCV